MTVEENPEWLSLFRGRTEWDKVVAFLVDLRSAVASDPLLWPELRDLMERAAREGLPYDKGPDGKGFKWPMERARNELGHLKMDEADEQHRIYFSAPAERETHLLALLYGPKRRSDPDWKEVQDEHIDVADDRYASWRNEFACAQLKL
ncbi:hypothetical protein [Prescottella equi]|uniref:hypothetical protein n=1 Tax=Rhodococcus hoagii TaxID=43767 RepID=UPI00111BF59C|nr:hypothetical protein [Prescottella equi]